MWMEWRNQMMKKRSLPDFPFKCPNCDYEIKRWSDLGFHWSADTHSPEIKKCPKPPKTKKAMMKAMRKICGED